MADGDTAGKRADHLVPIEIAGDMAHGAMGMELMPVPAGDAGSFLPAMLEGVEAKAARTGTPVDLYKPLSAFANRPGGGVLLFGLDEDAGFKVVGVGNPRKLQEDLSGLAAQMEPPLRLASRWR